MACYLEFRAHRSLWFALRVQVSFDLLRACHIQIFNTIFVLWLFVMTDKVLLMVCLCKCHFDVAERVNQ